MVPMLLLILVLGVYPNLIFSITDDAVAPVAEALASVGDWTMLSAVLQEASGFVQPDVDFHAFAPEIVLTATIVAVLLADLFASEGAKGILPSLSGIGLLASLVPVLTLAVDGADRAMFGSAYTVDNFSLVFKAVFLLSAYVVVLLSTNYVAEGDYAEGEYYFLLLSAVLGMTVMASARPGHDLRRPRAALDSCLHARRVAEAGPEGQRRSRRSTT